MYRPCVATAEVADGLAEKSPPVFVADRASRRSPLDVESSYEKIAAVIDYQIMTSGKLAGTGALSYTV